MMKDAEIKISNQLKRENKATTFLLKGELGEKEKGIVPDYDKNIPKHRFSKVTATCVCLPCFGYLVGVPQLRRAAGAERAALRVGSAQQGGGDQGGGPPGLIPGAFHRYLPQLPCPSRHSRYRSVSETRGGLAEQGRSR